VNASDRLATRVLGFGLTLFAVLAVFSGVVRFVRPQTEAGLVPAQPRVQLVAEQPRAPARNDEASWGFSDRWFPLTKAVPPSLPQQRPAAPAAEELGRSRGEVLGEIARTAPLEEVPLPRRRPILANVVRVPLPRARPDGPAPQDVFVAVSVLDDRYPGP
jgi:hypothetical protein